MASEKRYRVEVQSEIEEYRGDVRPVDILHFITLGVRLAAREIECAARAMGQKHAAAYAAQLIEKPASILADPDDAPFGVCGCGEPMDEHGCPHGH